jgi:hypothetical protein
MSKDSKDTKPGTIVRNKTDQELTEKELGQVTGGDKKIDKASATFMQCVAGGKHFNQVTIVS